MTRRPISLGQLQSRLVSPSPLEASWLAQQLPYTQEFLFHKCLKQTVSPALFNTPKRNCHANFDQTGVSQHTNSATAKDRAQSASALSRPVHVGEQTQKIVRASPERCYVQCHCSDTARKCPTAGALCRHDNGTELGVKEAPWLFKNHLYTRENPR